ncbi:MAG: D-glycero-beta-D-manno-heptose-7-phosphate kinase [Dinghuibacter sp.]|nr:D-glycero-beta-D-manno-heptose-7-phosphate kinase [Dinghuibacter sp.]
MNILVIGDVMLDKYIEGSVSRVSPEAPVPVINVTRESHRIGGSGNVANNIVKLGLPVCLLGMVGNDNNAGILHREIEAAGIRFRAVTTSAPTVTKVRVIGNHQQIARIDYEQPGDFETEMVAAVSEAIQELPWTIGVISDYHKGVCTPGVCAAFIQFATAQNRKVIVDPKSNNWAQYAGAWLITPNFKEFCAAVGRSLPNEDAAIEEHGRALIAQYGIQHLLVTRSEKGMSLVTPGSATHIPTFTADVYDVSGAGDTVVAAIAASLAEGYAIEESVYRANVAAGIVVSKFGTYAVSKNELAEKLLSLK